MAVPSGFRVGRIGFPGTAPSPGPASIVHWHKGTSNPDTRAVIDSIDPNPLSLGIVYEVGGGMAVTSFTPGHTYRAQVTSTEASEVRLRGFPSTVPPESVPPILSLDFPGGSGTQDFPVSTSTTELLVMLVYATNSGGVNASGTVIFTDLGPT